MKETEEAKADSPTNEVVAEKMTALSFEPSVSDTVAGALNNVLANYQIYYMNLRGWHWNIKGPDFFTLHAQFEQDYTDAALFIDELAERILSLGRTPLHAYPAYLEVAQVPVVQNVTDGPEAVRHLLAQTNQLIALLREATEVADDEDDSGTEDMLTQKCAQLEKRAWMLAAYLG